MVRDNQPAVARRRNQRERRPSMRRRGFVHVIARAAEVRRCSKSAACWGTPTVTVASSAGPHLTLTEVADYSVTSSATANAAGDNLAAGSWRVA